MKKSLTIEELKSRVGKPVFVMGLIYGSKGWRVLNGNGFAGANMLRFTDCSEIPEEHQDKFRFFDEEVTSIELKEILDAEEKAQKRTGYERVEIEKDYYTITSTKEVADMREHDAFNANNEKRYKNGNYFNDETLCENIARAETLKYQLRRFAALNGGIPSKKDWKKQNNIKKYYIYYDFYSTDILIDYVCCCKSLGVICFKSEDACEKAIETFKDELMWYFTEFEEQLY